jgi:ribosome-binding ATPase YchF (GTP1/OBG family)
MEVGILGLVGSGKTTLFSLLTANSDISRGFIPAEVVSHGDLLEAGSLAACRERGTLRLEGKSYPVADGDIVHYRFNV